MREMLATVGKGFVGVIAPAGGIYVSILPKVEAWLRVASLTAGLIVAALTAWSLWRNLKK